MLIGAYFAGYAAITWQLSFPVVIVAVVLLSALLGFILGLRLSTLPVFSCALATIMLLYILQAVVSTTDFLGGQNGLMGIPRLGYILPVTWFCVLVVALFVYRLDNSRFGRAMEMIKVDPRSAQSVGINVRQYRIFLHTISASIGGIVGILFVFNQGSIVVSQFSPLLVTVFVFIFLGGVNTMWGVLLGTPILWAFYVFLPREITAFKETVYGILLILVMVLLPNGVLTKPLLRSIRNKIFNIVTIRSKKPDRGLTS
jgi:branched-chain amino acid transport system permease protein